MSINIQYFAGESWQNFRRNWVMTFGAVITIYLSLLLVGVFLVTGIVVNRIVKDVEEKVTIQVFLRDGISPEDVDALQKDILADPLVKSVRYTSKEKALEIFSGQMEGSPGILEQMAGNPLPASLDIDLKDPRTVREMADSILKNETFLSVCDRPEDPERSLKYGQQIVDKLFAFTRVIRIVEIAFVSMLATVSLIFISNTIRLAIYARRKEIGIMRLVGASNWFIRTPFLLEGMLQALAGAALAIATLVIVQVTVFPRLKDAVRFLAIDLGTGTFIQISAILVFSGIFIGLVGSAFAMRRYLKV
ncbi:MAG: permease-like cell division protein FtsX [Coriobacteriia bacterium]|nr:permease-like cell division protein FtsX [Coriobacteriia bacterium]